MSTFKSPPDPQETGRRLFARRSEAVIANYEQVSVGDWQPTEHECHANVTYWCEFNTNYKVVRGWLYFDFGNCMRFVRFTAHSVVEDENGLLIDITPTKASTLYPFIRAEEDEEAFACLIMDYGMTNIDFVIR